MNFKSKLRVVSGEGSSTTTTAQRLEGLSSELPPPPEPFGPVETLQIEIRLSLVGCFQWKAIRRSSLASLLKTIRDREQ